MSEIDARSIVTLVFFFISIAFVIQPFSRRFRVPLLGQITLKLNLITAPILAIAILWASQCIGATQIRNGIVGTDGIKPYNILILFSSLAYMAITLDITGVLQFAAFWVSNRGGANGRRLYFYFYLLLTLISMVVGNDPVILSGTAFLVYYTSALQLDPLAWLISEFAAANTASMVLFVGNPTNVVICEGFRINNAAFTAYTILPFIACSVACYIALMIQFRDPKRVPRKLSVTGKLDPRSVLLDPIGAIFGGVLLLICLTVVIILSFFHVDVWKVVLPFAGAKFIFDLCWDHYRFTHNTMPRDPRSKVKRAQTVDDLMPGMLKKAMTVPSFDSDSTAVDRDVTPQLTVPSTPQDTRSLSSIKEGPSPFAGIYAKWSSLRTSWTSTLQAFQAHFPTVSTAFPRLPFALIPFAFAQFILIEALAHQQWIDVFAGWLVKATKGQMIPVIWLVGVLGVFLCNIAGTNIGATILLTKVILAADFPAHGAVNSPRAAALALAVASNIGAVSFTFSASLAGLLWQSILKQKEIRISQLKFALWNALPLLAMTVTGLAVVTAEMVVIS